MLVEEKVLTFSLQSKLGVIEIIIYSTNIEHWTS